MTHPSSSAPVGATLQLADKIHSLEAQLGQGEHSGTSDAALHIRELLGLVFEALPHFVAICGADGALLYLNQAGLQLAGVSSCEGLTVEALFPPSAFANVALHEARKNGMWQGETELLAADGRRLPVAQVATSHRSRDGSVKFVSIVSRDISQRRAAEQALREQATLLEKAQDAVIVIAMDGRITRWSTGASRIYGWNANDAVGKVCDVLIPIEQDTQLIALQSTLEQGSWTGMINIREKNGGTLIVDSRWTLIRNEGGGPASILRVDSDVTASKRLESQMLRAQRMESIGSLAGGIAHDLNNILAPIVMGVDLLRPKLSDKDARATLDTIARSAQRGADLVRHVLSFARGVEGQRGPVSLAVLLRDIRTIVVETFPKSILFESVVDKGVGDVLGDMTQLHQVVLNLIVNARDAMPSGGRLSVVARNVSLDEGYTAMHAEARPGPHVVISVTDSGSGIAPENIAKVFDPFFTTKEVGKGTGLGLSTAYAIVKGHGGFINIYSEVGKGTEVRVYLPAQHPAALRAAEIAPPEFPRGDGQKILIVDDEEAVASVVTRALERYGYRALWAKNGAEAVAAFVRSAPPVDVVVTDMAMPVMDGPATIVALRAIDPAVKIVGASGLGSNGKFAHALGAGVEHFLQKPYTIGMLLGTLRTILQTAKK